MAKTSKADSNAPTYEQAIEQLEQLVEKIESGEIGLEESIKAYEQGVGLIASCRAILNQAEQRIEQLDAARQGELSAPRGDSGSSEPGSAADDTGG